MAAAELFSLKGKVALVTGASSGLGVRFAEVLADAGAAVALVARRRDRLAAVKARIDEGGGRAAAIVADVLDRAGMVSAFDRAEAELGVVDILVNNAGVVHADRAVELAEAEWRRVLGTNLDAALFWSQEAARRLIAANKGGAIINIAAYAVSKAGLIQLTKALGLELAGRGIRVNAIAPGWIITDLNREYLASERGTAILKDIPVARFGETRDLDGALLLLASDAGRFITGTTIVVDGGQVVGMRG
jgi:3-oxoacyl-[acyl-carrier protein] reductase